MEDILEDVFADEIDLKIKAIEQQTHDIFSQEDPLLVSMKQINDDIKKARSRMLKCKNCKNHRAVQANNKAHQQRSELKRLISSLQDRLEELKTEYEGRTKRTT